MSAMLIHLGGGTWVNPEDISAIEWNSARMEECPRLILRNGHRVNATHYQRENILESAESATDRMLKAISDKVLAFHKHPQPALGRLS